MSNAVAVPSLRGGDMAKEATDSKHIAVCPKSSFPIA